MNWFERYGIVGMSFFLFLGIFLLSSGAFNLEYIPEKAGAIMVLGKPYSINAIGGTVTFSFLPIGYILTISSQGLYYLINRFLKRGTHQKMFKKLRARGTEIEGLKEKDNESKAEVILTYEDRIGVVNPQDTKLLANFITKRFDVISINHGVMLAGLIAMIMYLIATSFSSIKIPFILLSIIIIIMHFVARSLEGQIIRLDVKILSNKLLKK